MAQKKPSNNKKKPSSRKKAVRSNKKRPVKSSKPVVSGALKEALKYVPAKERKALLKKYKLEAKESSTRKRAISKKKVSKLPPRIKPNVVKRKNKKGQTYYYNKRTKKFTSSKSWKLSRKRVRERDAQIAKIKKRKPRELTQFNKIQKMLAQYAKENKLDLGKDFNKYAKNIYDQNKNIDPKFIEQNIDQMFDDFSGYVEGEPEVKKRDFDPSFPFYQAVEIFLNEKYAGVRLIVRIADGDVSDVFEGSNDEFSEWFHTKGIYKHLRDYYNDSPVAMFNLKNTDWSTLAEYSIDVFGGTAMPFGMEPPTGEPTVPPIEGLPLQSEKPKPQELAKEEKEKRIKGVDLAKNKMEKLYGDFTKKFGELGFTEQESRTILDHKIDFTRKRTGKTPSTYMVQLAKEGDHTTFEMDELFQKYLINERSKWMKNLMSSIDTFKGIGKNKEEIRKSFDYPLLSEKDKTIRNVEIRKKAEEIRMIPTGTKKIVIKKRRKKKK